jgi:hypothetical protein
MGITVWVRRVAGINWGFYCDKYSFDRLLSSSSVKLHLLLLNPP